MKKNIILLSIVIILGIIAFYSVKKPENKVKNYDFSYREFAVKDIDQIQKIIIIKRNDKPLKFERKDKKWIINGMYLADKIQVENILHVFKRVRIKYVPPDAAVENIMKSMIAKSIKVELYDKNDEPLKKFYIGGSPQNSDGTYFVMEGSSKPLVMDIPGFKGNLRVRFNYTLDEWRDRTVISENPESLKEVTVKYFMDKNSSFKIIKNATDNYDVVPAFEEQEKIEKNPNQKIVKSYLLGFEQKGSEYIENSMPGKEDVVSRKPIAEIQIKREDGSTRSLVLYMLPDLDDEIQKDKSGLDKYFNQNVLRYIAKSDEGDLFLIQYEVFKDIFIRYGSFFSVNIQN